MDLFYWMNCKKEHKSKDTANKQKKIVEDIYLKTSSRDDVT